MRIAADLGSRHSGNTLVQKRTPSLGIPDRAPKLETKSVHFAGGKVGGGTGPRPMLRSSDDAGPDGIEFQISKSGPCVSSIQRTGVEAALPHVARLGLQRIQVGGVAAVRVTEGEGERVGARGHGNDVDVVRHQAEPDDGETA